MADADIVFLPAALRRRASRTAAVGRLPLSGALHGDVTFSLEPPCEQEPRHHLEACCLCRRPLRADAEVYMYRGDAPFCSDECRQEQMELDEAREREMRFQRRRHQHRRAAPRNLCVRASDAIVAG